MTSEDLTDLKTHFRFGENWSSFVKHVDDERVKHATESLNRLLLREEISGKRFLDIGCGSGLSMLAALHLGAAEAHGVDIDPQSVASAEILLSSFAEFGGRWTVRQQSILDLPDRAGNDFDIIHSWGVLHHTGAFQRSIEITCSLVPPGGYIVVALYRKTPLCGFWRIVKRTYSRSGPSAQTLLRATYKGSFFLGLCAIGRNPFRRAREYKTRRGMDADHDLHDWMGGYPYESVEPQAFIRDMETRGFQLKRSKLGRSPALGLWGSGCDEFTFVHT